jgi:hypothetical protein
MKKVIILSTVLLLLLLRSTGPIRAEDDSPLHPKLDCNSSYDPGIGALCIYGESSALAGHITPNPVRYDLIANYVREKDVNAGGLVIDTGGLGLYLEPRVKMIHSCYVHKKINMCDVYRAD